jgi:predicted nucleotidyltransferase
MTSSLNRYEVDESRPLDPVTLHILTVVNRVANDLNVPYIVVGATARDLLLFHVFGIPVTRATADVDFAVAVDTWERFLHLREALLESGEFSEGKIEHRLFLNASPSTEQIPVDLIPFGGIADRDLIHWPPDWETVMTVAGFDDAMAAAVHVKVNSSLTIPVASLAGLTVLKLFAWFDRQTSDKDALDLFRIISTYADAGNLDRLYGNEIRFMEEASYDIELAGAKLLGFDAHRICHAETLTKLRSLLSPETVIERLAERIRLSRFPLQPEQLPRLLSVLLGFAERLMQ